MVSRIASSAAGKKKIGRINKKGAHLSLFLYQRRVVGGRWDVGEAGGEREGG